MKTISNNSITVKVQSTTAATLKLLKEAGAKIGKTSLADLLAGRKSEACGFIIANEVAAPASAMSKTEIAQSIFDENFGTLAPKAIKAQFQADAGLSSHGANTYYYKMKKAAEAI